MFYPQLVAGPIERPQNLLHQFHAKHDFDYARVLDGLQLMAWGLFKKIVIADRRRVVVNAVYDVARGFGGAQLLFATVFLRASDLLRLLRLLGHRARHGAQSWASS